MVKKIILRPSFGSLIAGQQRLSLQGIGRPMSSLVVRVPHASEDGETVIPSMNVVREMTVLSEDLYTAGLDIEEAKQAIEAAELELAETKTEYDAKFLAHDTAIGEAETAIADVATAVEGLDGDIADAAAEAAQAKADALAAFGLAEDAATGPVVVDRLAVTGGATFPTTVMDTLIADQAFVDRLVAERIIVTSGEMVASTLDESRWIASSGALEFVDNPNSSTGRAIKLVPNVTTRILSEAYRVTPGERLYAKVHADRVGGTTEAGGRWLYGILGYNESGAIQSYGPYVGGYSSSEGDRIVREGELVVPEGVSTVRFTVYLAAATSMDSGAHTTVYDMSLRRMAGGELIVDGAVQARHVEAESVAAAVGTFIDAMMENLSVTGVAALKQVTTDALWAKLAVVDRLQVLQEIITTDMVATGAIVGDKIAANAVTGDHFYAGQNAHWSEHGLYFYAPVEGNQQWDDWQNRTPLIQLDPAGDVSIAVADNGEPTGGIDKNGTVWGNAGEFTTLTVGGVPVEDLNEGPRGVIARGTITSNFTVSSTNYIFLRCTANIEPGRQYRITMTVSNNMYITSSGTWHDHRIQIWTQYTGDGTPSNSGGVMRASFRPLSFTANQSIVMNADELMPDARVNRELIVGLSAYTNDPSGATIWPSDGLTNVTVEDVGPIVELQQFTPPSGGGNPNPAPKNTYTKLFSWRWGQGRRPNYTKAIDSRKTIGGYSTFGTDMSEWVQVGLDNMLTDLSGADMIEATLYYRVTQVYSGSSLTVRIGFSSDYNNPSGNAPNGLVWFTTHTAQVGKTMSMKITNSTVLARLKSGTYRSVVFGPVTGGSTSSYGYIGVNSTGIKVKYKK